MSEVTRNLAQGACFVWRTDIRGYYRHIRKQQFWHHVCRFVCSPVLRNIIKQYIWYTVEHGGEFFTPSSGICRGSALSPLLGDSFLWYVDSAFSRREDIFYVRYMDDFLFLSTRPWPLRRAIRHLHDYFGMQVLYVIRTKRRLDVLTEGLTGWGCGLMQRGPPV